MMIQACVYFVFVLRVSLTCLVEGMEVNMRPLAHSLSFIDLLLPLSVPFKDFF